MVVYDYWYNNTINEQSVPVGIRIYDYNNDIIPFMDVVQTIILCAKNNSKLIIPTQINCINLEIHNFEIKENILLPSTVKVVKLVECNIRRFNIEGSLYHVKCLNSVINHCVIPDGLISLHLQGKCKTISGPWPQDKLILDLNGECDIIPYYTKYNCRHIFLSYDMIKQHQWDFNEHHSITIIPSDQDYIPKWPLNGGFLEHPDSDWIWPYAFGPLYQQGTDVIDDSAELLKGKNIIHVTNHLGHRYHFYDPHYVIIPMIWDNEYLSNINCPCPDWKFDDNAEYVFFRNWMYDPDYKIIIKFVVSLDFPS
jgi:hypothetical protein